MLKNIDLAKEKSKEFKNYKMRKKKKLMYGWYFKMLIRNKFSEKIFRGNNLELSGTDCRASQIFYLPSEIWSKVYGCVNGISNGILWRFG